jgi:hypothetical protein
MNPLPRVKVCAAVLVTSILAGCVGVSRQPTFVLFDQNGVREDMTTNDYIRLRPAVEALVAEHNGRLVDDPRQARSVTVVRIMSTGSAGSEPALAVKEILPAARVWSSAGDALLRRGGAELPLPSQANGPHPSLQLAEAAERLGR